MSTNTKLVLSSLVKTKSSYQINDFAELDSFLLSNLTILSFSFSKKEQAISLINNLYSLSGISDPLLAISGRSYENISNKLTTSFGSNNPFKFFEITVEEKEVTVNANYVNLQINKTLFNIFSKTYLPRTSQLIGSDELLRDLFIDATINYISQTKTYNYSVYNTRVLQDKSTYINEYYGFIIEPLYNFYSKNFEDAFKTFSDKLSIMPNYYKLSTLVETNVEGNGVVTLNGNIQPPSKRGYRNRDLANKKYYDQFGQIFARDYLEPYIQTYSNSTKLSIVDVSSFDGETAIGTEDFPYSNTLTFSNNLETNEYDKFLINNNLHILGIHNFVANTTSSVPVDIYTKEILVQERNYISNGSLKDSQGRTYDNVVTYNTENNSQIVSLDYNKVFNFITSSTANELYCPLQAYSFMPFSLFDELTLLKNDASKIFTYIDLQTILNNVYQKYIDYNKVYKLEELKDITTIGYIVEKKNTNNVLLQSVFLLKDTNTLDVKYIDSQIPYDIDIKYEVYSIDLIPTISYIFESTEKFGTNGINTVCKPNLNPKFVKNLLFTKTSKLNDNPPIPSIPIITTYKNIDNLITINFTTQVSELIDKPISIFQSDQEIFNKIYDNFNRTDGKILFKTNDPLKSIQLFVLPNDKPSSYLDFQNINPINILMENKYSKNVNLSIQPNTKYYLFCRSIDTHDLISNPSSIFELEMVSDNGVVYPIIKEVNFSVDKNYDVKKSFKKYLHIKPSLEYTQLIRNEENSVDLGIDNQLWSQKYKIRITSKKSGKSFDINMSFNKEKQDLR